MKATAAHQEKSEERPAASDILDTSRLERVRAWGGASAGLSFVGRPATLDDLHELVRAARQSGRSVGLRGGGNSYGDAAMNSENILLDLRRLNRVLDWNPESGRIQVEPGVTLDQLWQYVLEDGWWPPVATGTSRTTMGGCAAMNVHGKNNWQVGPFGEHVVEFDLMLASGETITCSRAENSDVFHAAIGGFGMLGVFTRLTLQLKRVYSGLLDIETNTQPNLAAMFDCFDQNLSSADYIVGWLDAMASGPDLGRGDYHIANYLAPGDDPHSRDTLRPENQHLGPNLFGVVPRSISWMFLRPFANKEGMKLANMGKFVSENVKGVQRYSQPHAQFHFLLDYVPDFKKMYGSGGLIQYQPFIPRATALDAFQEILALCQRRGLPNFLTVLKRHRPDDFLMSYSVDGYSLAMDFRVTEANRTHLAALAREMDTIVLEAGGRFYFAKDSTLHPETAVAYLGEDRIERFRTLKLRCDPDDLWQTDLWRRVFP